MNIKLIVSVTKPKTYNLNDILSQLKTLKSDTVHHKTTKYSDLSWWLCLFTSMS